MTAVAHSARADRQVCKTRRASTEFMLHILRHYALRYVGHETLSTPDRKFDDVFSPASRGLAVVGPILIKLAEEPT